MLSDTVLVEGEAYNELEKLLIETKRSYKAERDEIVQRLLQIGRLGARQQWFRLNEGNLGDLVMALYDSEEAKLRSYGIRYGSLLIVVGGGGPKNVRAWQHDTLLKNAATLMIMASDGIQKSREEGDLQFSSDGKDFLGNLTIDTDGY